jgi:hypothetical protein
MLILIQIKYNQTFNDNIITLSWWLQVLVVKKYLKIYKK